jgi:hypothetical protein
MKYGVDMKKLTDFYWPIDPAGVVATTCHVSESIRDCEKIERSHSCSSVYPLDNPVICYKDLDVVRSCFDCVLYSTNRPRVLNLIKKETIRRLHNGN